MQTAMIIFTAGTVVSFLPLYWLALRLSARLRPHGPPKRRADCTLTGRKAFFELLRREGAERAVFVLREALVEVRLAADRGRGGACGLSDETCRGLAETSHLIDTLFQGELAERFRRAASALMSVSDGTLGAAHMAGTSAMEAFERVAEGRDDPAAAPRNQARSDGILRRVRGWMLGGVARAAA